MMKLIKYVLSFIAFSIFMPSAAQQYEAPVSGAPPKAFSTLPDNLGFLQNSVNLFSGQVQFSLPVSGIAGTSGLSYGLSINYSSKVKMIAETWNREAPTGILGLGWNIDLPRIIADHKGTGTREDDTFYIVEGGSTNELFFDGIDGSEWKYYPKAYQFWKIRYNPVTETWTIIKDDGIKYVYGDKNNNRKTVQYMIKWGNWIGNSSLATGQQQLAYVWNLSEIIDLWNDKITFEYQHDEEKVGGGTLNHTKASYLKEIKNSIGERITLVYQNKLYNQVIPGTSTIVHEYQDPHTEQSYEPDAYQEKYESKFLERVIKYDQFNKVMEEVRFGYGFMGTGELVKRLLSSITKYSFGGAAWPAFLFEYEQNYDNEPNVFNTGALKKITAPTSGTIEFTYELKTLTQTSLDFVVQPVAGYYEPQFWIGDDFVVISRRQTNGGPNNHTENPKPVIIDVFTWEGGKWIQKNLGANYATTGTLRDVKAKPVSEGSAIREQDFKLAMGKDFFATLNRRGDTDQYDLNLFKRNDALPGEWHHHYQGFSRVYNSSMLPYVELGTEPVLLAGEDFVLIGAKEKRFFVFEWNGTGWSSWQDVIDQSGDDHFYAAGHNYFIIHNENNLHRDEVDFYYKNKAGQWQVSSVPSALTFDSQYSGSSYWYAGPNYAVVLANDNTELIYTWDENFTNFNRFNTNIAVPDDSPVVMRESMVLVSEPTGDNYNGFAYRFDGQNWIASGVLSYFGQITGIRNLFSMGEDFIYRPNRIYHSAPGGGHYEFNGYVRRFNANSRKWSADLVFPRVNNNLASVAGHNFFINRGSLFFKNTNGTFSNEIPTQLTPFIYGGSPESSWPINAGLDFFTYTKINDYSIYSLVMVKFKNGQLHSETNFGYGERIFDMIGSVTGFVFVPSPQVVSNTIVAYVGNFSQQSANSFHIYRKVGLKAQGQLYDFIVTRVTTNDGTAPHHTTYAYDLTTATTDVSGYNFQFNKVTTIPGSANPAETPYGYTVSFFMNGKKSSEVDQNGTFPAVAGNMASYLNKFTGLPYKSLTYNATGTLVAKTATDYNHNFWNQYSSRSGFFIRPLFNVAEQDGIKVQTQYLLNTLTYQVDQEIVRTLNTSNAIIQTATTQYSYWWQSYDLSLSRNILTPVISKRLSVDGFITEQISTRYKDWGTNAKPAPADIYRWVGPDLSGFEWNAASTPSSNWQLVSKITVRDEVTGAEIETVGSAGQITSVILDETKRFPIAKIVNATLSETGYCGFEDSSTGGFSWSDGGIVTGPSKTGVKHFSLGTNGIGKTGLASDKKYKVSFWAKSAGGSVVIDGISGIVNLGNLPDWTLFEFTVSDVSLVTIRRNGATDVLLDDVRIHPVNAIMTNRTFHNVLGVTSETGPDNSTIYYEYDTFGRAKLVRDEDKNIIRHSYSNIKIQ